MTMWDPFREFGGSPREMARTGGDGPSGPRMRLAFLPGRAARQYPMVNLHDDGENFYVEALMPGVDPSNLEVTVVGNTLTLAGQKPPPGDVPPERIHRSERAAGRFMRNVQMPTEIERERVGAEYRNGLLLLTLPRAESVKPRRIQVQAAGGPQDGPREVRNDG